jgi:hypothetical protein
MKLGECSLCELPSVSHRGKSGRAVRDRLPAEGQIFFLTVLAVLDHTHIELLDSKSRHPRL